MGFRYHLPVFTLLKPIHTGEISTNGRNATHIDIASTVKLLFFQVYQGAYLRRRDDIQLFVCHLFHSNHTSQCLRDVRWQSSSRNLLRWGRLQKTLWQCHGRDVSEFHWHRHNRSHQRWNSGSSRLQKRMSYYTTLLPYHPSRHLADDMQQHLYTCNYHSQLFYTYALSFNKGHTSEVYFSLLGLLKD